MLDFQGQSQIVCFRFRLYAGLAVLLANLLEGEGSLADTGAGGFVVNLVNVVHDGSNLLFQLGDDFLHGFRFLWVNIFFYGTNIGILN